MGYYIETPQSKNKAEFLVGAHNAERVDLEAARAAHQKGKGIVCVVDNGPFEAAGFCYDGSELEDFAAPDGRRKTWLVMDRTLAAQLSNCPH